jgi:radical SAM superfamily enzyme YgiQ (UPF0313 family)
MTMRILLISVNRSREIMPCMPAGIACLISALKEHDVQVLDLFWEENPEEALRKALRNIQPGLVGLSIRNIDNQLWSRTEYYLPAVKRYVEVIREETAMPIVIGGAGYSIYPYDALNYLEADWGIAGDGEIAFPSFIKAIENCRDPSHIPGVIKQGTSGERFAPPRVEDYNQIPLPSFDSIRLKDYQNMGGALSILARRGCPYECIYCDAPVSEGHAIKGKSPARLVDDIEAATHNGVTGFFIADNVFNYPMEYARAVAEEILRRNLKISWGATLHPRGIDEGDVRLLRRAGFIIASVGADSGSPEMMQRLRKGFTLEEISHLCVLLKDNGIRFFLSFLLGGPGESKSTVEESIKLALSAKADLTTVRVGMRITPLTEIHKISIQKGVLDSHDNLLEPRFYVDNSARDWIFDYLKAKLGGTRGFIVQ